MTASRLDDSSSISGESSASLDGSEDDVTDQQALLYENELNAIASTLVTVTLTVAIDEMDKELNEKIEEQESAKEEVNEEGAEQNEGEVEKVEREDTGFFTEENFVSCLLQLLYGNLCMYV